MDAVAGPSSGSLRWNTKQEGIVPLVDTFQSLYFVPKNDKSQSQIRTYKTWASIKAAEIPIILPASQGHCWSAYIAPELTAP